jgi:hypothetical protein|tara:strand:- start:200 stop:346 length:147 start_codon:yes stop_codon:yes gene_type:complete
MGVDFEWITGFAIGLDYLEEIEVKGADYEISIIRLQLGFFALYIPINV